MIALTLPLAQSALADTALFVGGIGEPILTEPVMSQALNGAFTGTAPDGTKWVRQSITWPAQAAPYLGMVSLGQSVEEGTDNLYNAITDGSVSGPITVVGASAGALVVDETLRRLASDPNAPDPKNLTFVVIADGSRQDAFKPGSLLDTLSGYTYQTPAQTQYNVKVVTYEYDGFADFPDNPLNLLADVNAVAGILVEHNATFMADLSTVPASNITTTTTTNPTTGATGTTTRYLIPAQTLPLVTLIPSLAPMEATLKQLIDTGYTRNDPTTTSSANIVSTALVSKAANPASAPVVDPTSTPVADPSDTAAAQLATTPTRTRRPIANAISALADSTDRLTNALTKASARAQQKFAAAAQGLTSGNPLAASAKGADASPSASSARDAAKKAIQNFKNSVKHLTGAAKGSDKSAGVKGDSGSTAHEKS